MSHSDNTGNVEHATDERIADYRARRLSRTEAQALETHLAGCADCRARALPADRARAWGAAQLAQFAPVEDDHLEYEALLAYVRREDGPVDREIAQAHLEDCPACQESERDLRAFLAARSAAPAKVYAPKERSRWSVPALGRRWPVLLPSVLALLVLALVGAATLFRPRPKTPIVAGRPETSRPAPVVTHPKAVPPTPKPHSKAVTPRPVRPSFPSSPPRPVVKQPKPVRTTRPTPERRPEKPTLVAALPEDASGLPPWAKADLERVREVPPVYRSDALPPGPAIRLVSPDPGNASLIEARPTLRWEGVPGAQGYSVRLETVPVDIDAQPRTLAQTDVEEPAFQAPEPLPRGELVRLTVTAMGLPEGADPVEAAWQLRVLNGREAEQAQWAETNARRYPITAAMVLYRLERLAEAAQVAKNWPRKPGLSGWEAALTRETERRRANPSE